MHVKEPTSLLAKEQGDDPGEVVSQSNQGGTPSWSKIRKRVYDVDPSWFTLEGYITVCSLYERRQPGI